MQVASVFEIRINEVKQKYEGFSEIVVQSDNATYFASQEHIPFLHHTSAESRSNGNPIVTDWIFTEAQTGLGRLDTHFHLILKAYIEDGNVGLILI